MLCVWYKPGKRFLKAAWVAIGRRIGGIVR